ncbi:hypothetical protein [Riemerella anatipestifer]|uniref:hypothetical protein n=1 Tax=Riemerella anatipestifer TaxID=34085 RepID=UPI00129D59B6|nr:hypothetical protein [Riemerella anatipestifer]MRM84286.1 hypothetical protein [Riemerella anatipestifer]
MDRNIEIETAEKKFNTIYIELDRLITKAYSIIDLIPQKGDKTNKCQKITLLSSLKDFEHALSGLCVEDFI